MEVTHHDLMLVVAPHGDPLGHGDMKSLTVMGPAGQLGLAWEEFLEVVS